MFEFGIAAEVFGLARPEMGEDWYRFVTCAEHDGSLRTNSGLHVTAERGLDALAEAATIVIPGWRSDGASPSPALCTSLCHAIARGARLVAICSGAFLPASLGLLHNRRATTHWRYAAHLQALYPTIAVDPDILYLEDGGIFTSAGSAAGIDLLLHIVRLDFGAEAANSVARRMVVAPHRQGGQAQFIERPVPVDPANQLATLLDRIRAQPCAPWPNAQMARDVAMSERTFARRFRDATGSSPGSWLMELRLAAAQELLETTNLPIDRIAQASGLGSAANLRLQFTTRLGIAPSHYRRQFQPRSGSRPPTREAPDGEPFRDV